MFERRPSVVALFAILLVCLLAGPAMALPGSSVQELFERAEALYRQLEVVDPAGQASSWQNVVNAFSDVAERYPDSPLAAEALWRVAGIFGKQRVGRGRPDARELVIYQELVRLYPDNPHAPEALFRLAAGAEGEAGARSATLYARLLQQYPNTPQASLVRNRLAEAGSRGTMSPTGAPSGEATEESREAALAGSGSAVTASERVAPGRLAVPAPELVANLRAVRHYSDSSHTRVVLDLDGPATYEAGEASNPARLYLDLPGVRVPDKLPDATLAGSEQVLPVRGEAVESVRVGINRPGVARVVLDLVSESRYSLFALDRPGQPYRIVIDVPTAAIASRLEEARRPPEQMGGSLPPVTRQLQLGVRRIVIDPGHGGQDPGAIGRTGITEKQLTLDLADGLATEFRKSGYEVVLTRREDRTVSLKDRTQFANRAEADLFVSLHVNSARNRKLGGFETYYLDLATDPSAAETAARENAVGQVGLGNLEDLLASIVKNDYKVESSDLAKSIQDSLVMTVSQNYEVVRDLGVKSAPFFVLVGADMPSVLIEASFLSNPEEETRLRDPEYRQQLVKAIHDGILSYAEDRGTTTKH